MILETSEDVTYKVEKLFFKVIKKLTSYYCHFFKLRPSSYPYLTGDSFRKIADHIHDETKHLNPNDVKLGDVVFVGNTFMREFLISTHPKISEPYILIQHNGDNQVDEEIASLMDDKIIRFYAQCVLVIHEKIIPIPIGIENFHHGNELLSYFFAPKSTYPKKPRVFYHFSPQTNPSERIPASAYFKSLSIMDTIDKFVPYWNYKKLLASYAFTVSPAGNTLGSHRTWEALYLKTIPIVKRTADAEACVSYGLPLWIVDEWQELGNYTEQVLDQKYKDLMSMARFDALSMDYWINRVKKEQKLIRNKEL